MSQESLPIVPACMHLRSKNMYVSGTVDPARDDYEFEGDGYCWCNKTQHSLGPDDRFAERPLCSVAERSCYERIA